jgi:putative DNA primase/helicase
VIYSNEVLQLTENSNALTGRMIVIRMTKSFYNQEDTGLFVKLEKELSGIFNWAMRGLARRLSRGGHFIQPESGRGYLELMEELGNPIKSFTEDALVFEPNACVPKDSVFMAYKKWALNKSIHPGTDLVFKRQFSAAVQEHCIRDHLDRSNGNRTHMYLGVKLNEKAQKFIDNQVKFDEEAF